MFVVNKRLSFVFSSMILLALCDEAAAGVIVNVVESGGNVVATISGSLSNLGSASSGATISPVAAEGGFQVSTTQSDHFYFYNTGSNTYGSYSFVSGPSAQAWGNGTFGSNTTSSSAVITGADVFLFTAGGALNLDVNYSFGTPINGTLSFDGSTLASMGIANLGTRTYIFGDSGNGFTDTVTFTFTNGGGAAVPEPSSLAIGSICAIAVAVRARRRAKIKLSANANA